MEVIRKNVAVDLHLPSMFNCFNSNDIVILDIETTGLHRVYSQVILVGIILFNNKDAEVIQIFADNPSEEAEVLDTLANIIKNKSLLLTYNGQAFDIPYLNGKYKQHNIDFSIPLYKSFDLLRLIRKNKTNLSLENYKLKSVENFLGINRNDTISGKESVDLYNNYVTTKSIELRKKILLHNFEDVLNIIDLVQIFDHCSDFSIYDELKYPLNISFKKIVKANTSHLNEYYAYSFIDNPEQLYVETIKVLKNHILISIYVEHFSKYDLEYQKKDISLKYNLETSALLLTVPTVAFHIEETNYIFFDIDPIIGDGNFNKLNVDDKLKLNFSVDNSLNYSTILSYLEKYLLSILKVVST